MSYVLLVFQDVFKVHPLIKYILCSKFFFFFYQPNLTYRIVASFQTQKRPRKAHRNTRGSVVGVRWSETAEETRWKSHNVALISSPTLDPGATWLNRSGGTGREGGLFLLKCTVYVIIYSVYTVVVSERLTRRQPLGLCDCWNTRHSFFIYLLRQDVIFISRPHSYILCTHCTCICVWNMHGTYITRGKLKGTTNKGGFLACFVSEEQWFHRWGRDTQTVLLEMCFKHMII